MDIWRDCIAYQKGIDQPESWHIGEHFQNLCITLEENHDKFIDDLWYIKHDLVKVLHERRQERNPSEINIAFMCGHGRHRSVAVCRLVLEVLKRVGYNVDGPYYLSQESWKPSQCTKCVFCDPRYKHKPQLYDEAVKKWHSIRL